MLSRPAHSLLVLSAALALTGARSVAASDSPQAPEAPVSTDSSPPASKTQDSPDTSTTDPDEPGETIWVYEDGEVKRSREQIGLDLRTLGYRKKYTRDGRDVYVSGDAYWKPWVIVDHDGYVMIKRAPASFAKPKLPGIWAGPLGYLVCVVNPTACVHIGGLIVSNRKLNPRKQEILYTIDPAVDKFENVLLERGMRERTEEIVPDMLDLLWEKGVPIGNTITDEIPLLSSWEDRRAALVAFWRSRVDDSYGDRVRQVIETWSRAIVQSGEHPFTQAEIASARAANTCSRPIDGLFFEPEPQRSPE